MNPLPVVLADLRRSRAGVIAVVLLIAIAAALGVAISAQERALRQGSAQAADGFDLLIGAPGSETQLVLSTVYLQTAAIGLIDGAVLQDLQGRPSVRYASPLGFGDSYQGYPVVGVSPDFVTDGGERTLVEGRNFGAMNEVVVGIDVRLDVGESFTPIHGNVAIPGEDMSHGGAEYTVVGRLPRQGNPWDRAIMSPVEAVWWVHGFPTGHVALDQSAEPRLTLADAARVATAAGVSMGPPWDGEVPGVPAIVVQPVGFGEAYSLRAEFRADETMALFPAEVLVQLYNLLGDVRDLMALISIVTQVLVIGAVLLAIFATLAMRQRLLGVLRALGASRTYVFLTVWLGVSLMIALGALLGLFLGWGGALLLSWILSQQTAVHLPVAVGRPELLLIGALILVGLVLAALPSLAVYRRSVSALLRA